MKINADFGKRIAMHATQVPWKPSPMPGVDRQMLDRMGDEVARATSIVRYAPGSKFSRHTHTGGEEFMVLDGVFEDEHGAYPEGYYIRNPPTTAHTPSSTLGSTIFVKLWQFDMADRESVCIDTSAKPFVETERAGVEAMSLFKDANEEVCLERWEAGRVVELDAPFGLELLVLEGGFEEGGEVFQERSWLRLPKDGSARVVVGERGSRVWLKLGHLKNEPKAPSDVAV